VKFGYDANASYRTENIAPFALAADNKRRLQRLDAGRRLAHAESDALQRG
jgi:hypothetical protein